MHLEASFSFLGLPIQKLGMVEGQMGFSPTVDWLLLPCVIFFYCVIVHYVDTENMLIFFCIY